MLKKDDYSERFHRDTWSSTEALIEAGYQVEEELDRTMEELGLEGSRDRLQELNKIPLKLDYQVVHDVHEVFTIRRFQ